MLYTRFKQKTAGTVTELGAAVPVTSQKHGNKITTLDRVTAQALTLPKATGSGDSFQFVLVTAKSANLTIKVPDAAHVMLGNALVLQDAGDTVNGFETAVDSDTITMNGTTTGGLVGTLIVLTDIAKNKYFVEVIGAATGVEATPFSATV